MNTTMTKKDSSKRGAGASEPPEEVMNRIAELPPAAALDEAAKGLKPEDLPVRAGCCPSSRAGLSRPRSSFDTLVPGIGLSPNEMVLARGFSYSDAQRARLGVNYKQIR